MPNVSRMSSGETIPAGDAVGAGRRADGGERSPTPGSGARPVERGGAPPRRGATRPDRTVLSRGQVLLLVGAAVAVTAWYLLLGTGFVLDDWYTLGNARVDGAWAAAGEDQRVARPGAWVLYALVFGVVGEDAAVVVVLLGVVSLLTALLLARLLTRFVPSAVATAVALAWLVLPNHTSLEVWASAVNIAVAVLALVGGLVLVAGLEPDGERSGPGRARLVGASAALGVGVLCYEAVAPAALAGALALPWLRAGRPRWRATMVAATGPVLAMGWILANWHPAKDVKGWVDASQAVGGHLGWGIVPAGPAADLATVVGLAGSVAAAVVVVRGRSTAPRATWLVLAGWAVVVLGVVPFLRYLYAPLGAGDRFSCVSAIGGAMVWVGLGWWLHGRRREAAVVAAAALLAGALVQRAHMADLWSRAGDDSRALEAEVRARFPEPPAEPLVFGPAPVQEDNVVAVLDASNVRGMLRWIYGTSDVDAVVTYGTAEFEGYPASRRIDMEALSSLDVPDRAPDAERDGAG